MYMYISNRMRGGVLNSHSALLFMHAHMLNMTKGSSTLGCHVLSDCFNFSNYTNITLHGTVYSHIKSGASPHLPTVPVVHQQPVYSDYLSSVS